VSCALWQLFHELLSKVFVLACIIRTMVHANIWYVVTQIFFGIWVNIYQVLSFECLLARKALLLALFVSRLFALCFCSLFTPDIPPEYGSNCDTCHGPADHFICANLSYWQAAGQCQCQQKFVYKLHNNSLLLLSRLSVLLCLSDVFFNFVAIKRFFAVWAFVESSANKAVFVPAAAVFGSLLEYVLCALYTGHHVDRVCWYQAPTFLLFLCATKEHALSCVCSIWPHILKTDRAAEYFYRLWFWRSFAFAAMSGKYDEAADPY
jgi:hypothetical protein